MGLSYYSNITSMMIMNAIQKKGIYFSDWKQCMPTELSVANDATQVVSGEDFGVHS